MTPFFFSYRQGTFLLINLIRPNPAPPNYSKKPFGKIGYISINKVDVNLKCLECSLKRWINRDYQYKKPKQKKFSKIFIFFGFNW